MEKETIGIIAGIISALGFVPYIYEVVYKAEKKPSAATWLIWTVAMGLATVSAYEEGARAILWVCLSYFLGASVILCLSFNYGTGRLTRLDLTCLASAAVSIAVWGFYDLAVVALLTAIVIDASGAIPTIAKMSKEPQSESKLAWGIWTVGNIINLGAIQEHNLANLALPIYFVIICILIYLLTFRRAGRSVLVS